MRLFQTLVLSFIGTVSLCTSYADPKIGDCSVLLNSSLRREIESTPLTLAGLKSWYSTARSSEFTKQERVIFDRAFTTGVLPKDYHLTLSTVKIYPVTYERVNLEWPGSIYPRQVTIMQNGHYQDWKTKYQSDLDLSGIHWEEDKFSGSFLSPTVSGSFPSSVPVKIKETKAVYGYGEREVLQIDFEVNRRNSRDLAHYFGTAYDENLTLSLLQKLLGTEETVLVPIQSLLQGWIAEWGNRFPAEKGKIEGNNANDVCHGAARQFFQSHLSNQSGKDRSGEATQYLLQTQYQLLNHGVDPAFGDYLYIPYVHSIRFILKDPKSGRWIGFSTWSSATYAPYRFWWVDQDYSSPPPGYAIPQARPEFQKSFDIWRKVDQLCGQRI